MLSDKGLFWKATNDAYASLRADKKAWIKELSDREVWDQTLMDGLGGDQIASNLDTRHSCL